MKKIEYNNSLVKKTFINKEKIYPSTYNELNRVVIELIDNNNLLEINIDNDIENHNNDKNAHINILNELKCLIWCLKVFNNVLISTCGNFFFDDCLYLNNDIYNFSISGKTVNIYIK